MPSVAGTSYPKRRENQQPRLYASLASATAQTNIRIKRTLWDTKPPLNIRQMVRARSTHVLAREICRGTLEAIVSLVGKHASCLRRRWTVGHMPPLQVDHCKASLALRNINLWSSLNSVLLVEDRTSLYPTSLQYRCPSSIIVLTAGIVISRAMSV